MMDIKLDLTEVRKDAVVGRARDSVAEKSGGCKVGDS